MIKIYREYMAVDKLRIINTYCRALKMYGFKFKLEKI